MLHLGKPKEITISYGASLGSVVAAILSWDTSQSILLMIIHSFLSWFYVGYYAARYILFP